MSHKKCQLPEELQDIIEDAKLDKFGDTYNTNIIKAEFIPDFVVTFNISYYGVGKWQVSITDCQEFKITHEDSYEEELAIYDEHILLDKYNIDEYRLYTGSNPVITTALISDIYLAHNELFGDDVPTSRYLYNNIDNMLAGSYGIFARGPQAALLRYKEVLDKHGIVNNILLEKSISDANTRPYKLLTVGGGMFIAKEFLFEKIH